MVYAMIALKLLVGLLALITVTRLLGKKQLSQVTPFDFVYALILGGLVEENLFEKKASSILEMLFGILIWAVLIFVFEKITQKSDKLRPILKGEAEVLIKNGIVNIDKLRKSELEMEQLRALLRQKGVFSLNDVKDVILETSGTISVLLKPEAQQVTYKGLNVKAPIQNPTQIVIDDGKPNQKGLKALNKDARWLKESLKKNGVQDLKNVYYAEWSQSDGFYIRLYNGKDR
ncbi:DUF421 domain-containing protein [Mesobacillus foraminis]|uniref:DUF421 domain-containing protein n=1 Tax=Mesobacillus foraminis TaxID=279826 RepID=UPI001BEA8B65|nr:DUF421 domain-containing protein [Mesobacillus foraminis]MBT2756792.1 DUF421 domain-containing protein [Mesobacillus foraminis]